ncbi:ATP-binding protein [Streptomyces sp. NPDC002172]
MRITGSRQGHTQARTFTHRTACHWSLDHLSNGAATVVTELAANAVTHAVPQAPDGEAVAWLTLRLDADHLMCAVTDPSGRPPVYPRVTDSSEENGRGLCIVEAVSEDRGRVRHSPAGRTFWAPLPTSPAALTRLP